MRASAVTCVLVTLASFQAPVRAQETAVGDEAAEVARDAIELYRKGEHEQAATLFLRAYQLSGRATQLRNAAKAFEAADALDRALELWARYRDHDSISRDEAAEAAAHIGLIEERKRRQSAQRETEEARAAAERAAKQAEAARLEAEQARLRAAEAGDSSSSLLGWVGLGAGGAMLAASGALWIVQGNRLAKLDDALGVRRSDGLIVGITPGEVDAEVNSINNQRLASGILLGTGIAASVGSVAWIILSGSGPRGSVKTSVSPSTFFVHPRGVGWRTTW